MTTLCLITPTADREHLLPLAYQCLQQQTYSDWQWWICDTSWKKSNFIQQLNDPRVHYIFEEQRLSIGQKRNLLIEACQGELIFHIDDDDYYAPDYLQRMYQALQGYDFCSLNSWFAYDVKIQQGFYWNTTESADLNYVLTPVMGTELQKCTFADPFQTQRMASQGYGFTYCYHQHIWKEHPFPDLDHKEDHVFFMQLSDKGCAKNILADQQGSVVKIMHDLNVSSIFPQYRIPTFLFQSHLPAFMRYLDAYRLAHCQ